MVWCPLLWGTRTRKRFFQVCSFVPVPSPHLIKTNPGTNPETMEALRVPSTSLWWLLV